MWELVLRLPETTQTSVTETLSDEEWQVVRGAIDEAIEYLVDFRKQEGEALYKKFTEKLITLSVIFMKSSLLRKSC